MAPSFIKGALPHSSAFSRSSTNTTHHIRTAATHCSNYAVVVSLLRLRKFLTKHLHHIRRQLHIVPPAPLLSLSSASASSLPNTSCKMPILRIHVVAGGLVAAAVAMFFLHRRFVRKHAQCVLHIVVGIVQTPQENVVNNHNDFTRITSKDFCLSNGESILENKAEDIQAENLTAIIGSVCIEHARVAGDMKHGDMTGYMSPRPSLASPAGDGDIELEVLGGWCGSSGHDVPGGEVADEECETWLAVADYEEPPRTDLEARTERKAKGRED